MSNEPLTEDEIEAKLRAAAKRWENSGKEQRQRDAILIERLLRGGSVTFSARDAQRVANAVVKATKCCITAEQMKARLRGYVDVNEIDAIVDTAIAYVSSADPSSSALPEIVKPARALEVLNASYAWVESADAALSLEDLENERELVWVSEHALKTTWNISKVSDKDDLVGAGSWWIEHPKRLTYKKVGTWCPPQQPPANALNLWRGFAIEPKQGDWSKLRAHIRDVIANGNADYDAYIMCWLAWVVQHPGERAETALVLYSPKKGIGKSLLGEAMVKIFGTHGFPFFDGTMFSKNFNAESERCLLGFLDEATLNKRAEPVLNMLITGPHRRMEGKQRNAYITANRTSLIIAANKLIPASADERRYNIFEVSDSHQEDWTYFDAIHEEMRNGGLQAMLYDLLAMELVDWHPRRFLKTNALKVHKEHALDDVGKWLLDLVSTGELPGHNSKDWCSSADLLKDAREGFPRGDWNKKVIAEAVKKLGAMDHKSGGQRGWKFPALAISRANWTKAYFERAEPWDSVTGWGEGPKADATAGKSPSGPSVGPN